MHLFSYTRLSQRFIEDKDFYEGVRAGGFHTSLRKSPYKNDCRFAIMILLNLGGGNLKLV